MQLDRKERQERDRKEKLNSAGLEKKLRRLLVLVEIISQKNLIVIHSIKTDKTSTG